MAAYIHTLPDKIHYEIKDKDGVLRFHVKVDVFTETVEITKDGHSRDTIVFPLHLLDVISSIFSDTEKIISLKPKETE